MTFSNATLARLQYDCLTGKVQFSASFGTEYFADGNDLTIDVATILSETTGDLSAIGQCGEVYRPVEDGDFIAQIDIDLLPIEGGHGQLGETERTTTSECVVHWTDGRSQNMDGGGSITIGAVKQNQFYKKSEFSHIEIKDSSGVKVSYIVAGEIESLN